MALRANAHAERWVGTVPRECLDWILIVSQGHLEAVLCDYCAHYTERDLIAAAVFGHWSLEGDRMSG